MKQSGIIPLGVPDEDSAGIDIGSLEWQMCSISELSIDQAGEITLTGPGSSELGKRKYRADDVFLIRVWRPHPRHWWQADSPTRSSLPVLRELVGLTMGISAQIDSRLAGAGILWIPQELDAALRAAAGATGEDDESPLTEALLEAMITPISDRSNASAVVPLMPVVPGEWIEKIRYDRFDSQLDPEYRALRDEAIRRLALGQDCPPELLLGVGCVTPGAKALTRRGWLSVDDLCSEDMLLTLDHDSGLAEWRQVEAVNRFTADGRMVRVRGAGIDVLTTPDHRWPVESVTCHDCGDPARRVSYRGRCSRCWKRARRADPVVDSVAPRVERRWTTSDQLQVTDRIILSAVGAAPVEPVFSDAYVEAAAWLATDGDRQTGGRARVRQRRSANPGKAARIDAATDVLTATAVSYDKSADVDVWTFDAEQMRPAGDWDGTRFVLGAEFVGALTGPQLELLLQVGILANGYRQDSTAHMWAKDPKRLEAFAMAAAIAGYRVSWRVSHPSDGAFGTEDLARLSIGSTDSAYVTTSIEDYAGEVWCPTVGNSSWYVQDEHGTVSVTGNSMNHWGAWLVREDVVTTHLEPPLALICDAITSQFLWPVLEQQGVEDFRDYVIWYDVDHMIQRPNRSQDAKDAKIQGAISDTAFRDALGFNEADAPDADPVVVLALEMLRQSPGLAQSPGILVLAEQIRTLLAGETPAIVQGGVDTPQPVEGDVPATADAPATEPGSPG